jgi:hypothetical protein
MKRHSPTAFAILLILTTVMAGCNLIPQQAQLPTPDIEKTVYWMVDDAVAKASTQIMFDVSSRIDALEERQAAIRIDTAEPTVEMEIQPTGAQTPRAITSIPDSIREKDSGVIQETQPACIDELKFIEDISIPDKTEVLAGKPFTKTWKIQNIGSCTWNDRYSIIFAEGDRMSALEQTAFPAEILAKPDDTIEISVYMTAPTEKGSYAGYWLLQSPSGIRFGAGKNRDKPIWVKVEVK